LCVKGPHYDEALKWYKELDALATKNKDAPIRDYDVYVPYDDTGDCQDCVVRKTRIASKAFDDANDDLSALPKLYHVFLRDAPYPRPPTMTGRCYSVCFVRDEERPRTNLATRQYAVLCGPCATLRLAVLHYFIEEQSSETSLLMHWEPLLEEHDDHASIQRAIDHWHNARGIIN
jgi:hypothetical protein